MKRRGAPRTRAAGQALRSWPGVLLTDAPLPQGSLARETTPPRSIVDRSQTELSHNPRPTLLSKRRLHAGSSPNTEHARVRETPHLHPPATNVQHEQTQRFRRRRPHSPQASLAQDTTGESLTSKHTKVTNCRSHPCAVPSPNGGSTRQLPATAVPLCGMPRKVCLCGSLQKQPLSSRYFPFLGEVTLGNAPSPKGRQIPTLSTFQMPCHTFQSTHRH